MLDRISSFLPFAALGAALLATAAGVSAAPRAGQPRIRHVFIIVLENKNYDETFRKSTQDPYLAKTLPARDITAPDISASTITSR